MSQRDRAAVARSPWRDRRQLPHDRQRLRRERLVELEQIDLVIVKPARSSTFRTAGTGPIPMILGSTPVDT